MLFGEALTSLRTDRIQVGEIPRYEMSPLDGSLKDGVFFYKDMRGN